LLWFEINVPVAAVNDSEVKTTEKHGGYIEEDYRIAPASF